MIKQGVIDDVLHKAQIEEVISQFLELKKAGSEFKAFSPWTKEKTPSFCVVPRKNFFKDFSSGKSGSVVTFLMEKEAMTYPQAIEWLCDFYQIPLEFEEKSESQEQQNKNKQADRVLQNVQRRYHGNFKLKPCLDFLQQRQITMDDVAKWGIGYTSTEWQYITTPIIENGLWEIAEELGLVKTTKGRNFDFFRGRVMFPIHDHRQRLVGFAGRLQEWDETQDKPAKYFNPKESWFYQKERILYGFCFARKTIAQTRTVYITEGYTDVIAMHAMDMENTVAVCGTALSKQHLRSLQAIADRLVLVLDADKAGRRAAERALSKALPFGFQVEVCELPEGMDPDELRQQGLDPEDFQAQIDGQRTDGLEWLLARLLPEKELSPADKGAIGKKFCEVVALIDDPVMRAEYLKLGARRIKTDQSALRKTLDGIVSKRIQKERPDKENIVSQAEKVGATAAEMDSIMEQGFCVRGDGYYFLPSGGGRDQRLVRSTNFTLEPLFHVLSDNPDDNKRLVMIKHIRRDQVVDMPSSAMVSWNDFQKVLANKGPFQFMPGSSQNQFRMLMSQIMEQFPECQEVYTLGQQPEGFYAFANGIVDRGVFRKVDDFGICEYEYEREALDGSMEQVTDRFYFPAFSSIYKHYRQDGGDRYQNDRHFVFRKSKIDFNKWMAQVYDAYQDYAVAGICYVVASLYRDVFFKRFNHFPLMFCYGEAGSGKSAFCSSLQALYCHKLNPFNLNTGTDVGFQSRLARLSGALIWCDEYAEDIEERRFQGLKGAYDGVGREKGRKSGRNKTEVTEVKSGLVISGQYLATRDDHSLTSRSIVLEFRKDSERMDQLKTAWEKLKETEEDGITGLVVELLRHRKLMEEHWLAGFDEFRDLLKQRLADVEYTARVLNNYSVLGSAFGVLAKLQGDKIKFPFTPDQVMTFCVKGVRTVSRLINSGEAAAVFWQIFSALIDKNLGITTNVGGLRCGVEYKIKDNESHVTLRNEGKNNSWSNDANVPLLYIRMSAVHQAYMKEHRALYGKVGMQKVTIENFLRARKYFIGTCPRTGFEDISGTSAHVFRLDMLEDMGYTIRRTSNNSEVQVVPSPAPAEPKPEAQLQF